MIIVLDICNFHTFTDPKASEVSSAFSFYHPRSIVARITVYSSQKSNANPTLVSSLNTPGLYLSPATVTRRRRLLILQVTVILKRHSHKHLARQGTPSSLPRSTRHHQALTASDIP